MHIKILGSGCKNCITLERNTRAALADLNLDAEVTKVTNYPDIVSYGILSTPGLVVDEKVIVSGRVPKPAEIRELLASLAG